VWWRGQVNNPDGSTIRVVGWGNQFSAVFETPDGYTIIEDPETGFYNYARLSHDGSTLIATDGRVGVADPEALGLSKHVRVRADVAKATAAAHMESEPQTRWQTRRNQMRARKRTSSEADSGDDSDEGSGSIAVPAAAAGSVVGLCLLVQFPDVPGTIPQHEEDFCNQQGYTGYGNKGSVYDYFYDISGGILQYTNVVTAYITARHKRAYYTDPSVIWCVRARVGRRGAQSLAGECLQLRSAYGRHRWLRPCPQHFLCGPLR
jgi:hypothetical protein